MVTSTITNTNNTIIIEMHAFIVTITSGAVIIQDKKDIQPKIKHYTTGTDFIQAYSTFPKQIKH